MDTQLVRLDAPYNIICDTTGKFALHIATLIIVKEKVKGVPKSSPMSHTLSVASYPVVSEKGLLGAVFIGSGKGKADGQVWMHTELKDCYVVCPQNHQSVDIRKLKDVMEYYAKQNIVDMNFRIPISFGWAMTQYGCKILLPEDENRKPIKDYDVCLEFEESNNGKSCMVYADNKSLFYFYEYFDNESPFDRLVRTNSEAINHMANLCNIYIQIFRYEGVKSITFTTKNEQYQWFVDKLNATKFDGD